MRDPNLDQRADATSATSFDLAMAAPTGQSRARSRFARRYLKPVRAFLLKRWRSSPRLLHCVDDAVQDTFVDLFRPGGALARLDPARLRSVRTFVFGVTCNVARRYEEKTARERARQSPEPFEPERLVGREASAAQLLDDDWLRRLVRRACERHQRTARARDPAARERVELLQLRFFEGMPIREIARRWVADAGRLHRQYARARDEFSGALHTVVADRHRGWPPGVVERYCRNLLRVD